METWIAVPGYEGWYEVSNHGRARKIRRSRRGHASTSAGPLPHILAPLVYRKGYVKIHCASCDGTKPEKRMFLHRLVWIAFNGPIPDGVTINHRDGNKANNRLDNLELATHAEQYDHAIAIGLKPPRKITPQDARDIRELRSKNQWTYAELAKLYHVSISLVRQLVTRPAWCVLGDKWFT